MTSSKISPELSELVVYCRSVPFPGIEAASQKPPSEMSSFSENEALKHIKDSGETCLTYHAVPLPIFKRTSTVYVMQLYIYLYLPYHFFV